MTRLDAPAARPGFALALAAALALAVLPAAAQSGSEETFDRTLSARAGGTFRLHTFSGRVHIRGTDGGQVVIHAVRRASADRLRDIQIEVTQSGDTIEVEANHRLVERRNDNVVETDFEIQVPTGTRLVVNSFSAPVEVEQVRGSHRLKTFSADITLTSDAWNDQDGLDLETSAATSACACPTTRAGRSTSTASAGASTATCP